MDFTNYRSAEDLLPVLVKAISEFGHQLKLKLIMVLHLHQKMLKKYMDNVEIIHRKITPNYP